MVEEFLKDLNSEQQRAVESTEGPLLILAGAGSGKTKTLTHRIAYIIDKNLATPYNILAVTFTNKAAGEMRERVAQLLGHRSDDRSFMPFMGTFHSICVRLLRQDGDQIGIPKNFVIFDELDRTACVKKISKELSIDEKSFPARKLSSIISSAKNELITPEELSSTASSPTQKEAARVYPHYQRTLKDAMALDFDDLISRTVQMLSGNEQIRSKWQQQFRYVMIDEYQDTNAAQYKLIKLLTNENNNIAVVGDDWQSIYSWRGADFKNILNFEKDYKNCQVIKLEQNYRSTKHILDAAHSVISKNSHRSTKKLWTDLGDGLPVQIIPVGSERNEGEAIVRTIRNQVDSGARNYKDFAVLYRTNAQSRPLEEVFVHYGIPYRIVGGVRFYDRKEIKDIMAYLRLIYQPEDVMSFERIVNVPARSVGSKSLINFTAWRAENEITLDEALQNVEKCSDITPKARKGLLELADIVRSMRDVMGDSSVSGLVDSLVRRLDYLNYLDDGTMQSESRQENVKELLSVASEYEELGLDGFLEEVSLLTSSDNNDAHKDSVTLMTLHGAKGLEFPVVFMSGMEETVFPHSRALYDASEMEEERRLCYVGMTRAKQELYLLYASRRMLYGGILHNPPSRFLADVDSRISDSHQPAFFSESAGSEYAPRPKEALSVSNEPRYVPDLEIGDGINHSVFGKGTVVHMDGDIATISFGSRGTKQLDISLAPLQKIES
ncbi:MAG TPA: UvrD-helicase domain-containing protein [Candidatus Saccharibacteria bacterium]|nr:UvrD-helicase domain-containing protein [Candidatus Saccharibacteria bacterium]